MNHEPEISEGNSETVSTYIPGTKSSSGVGESLLKELHPHRSVVNQRCKNMMISGTAANRSHCMFNRYSCNTQLFLHASRQPGSLDSTPTIHSLCRDGAQQRYSNATSVCKIVHTSCVSRAACQFGMLCVGPDCIGTHTTSKRHTLKFLLLHCDRMYIWHEYETFYMCGALYWQEREVHAAVIPLKGRPRAPPAWTALSAQVAAAQGRKDNITRIHHSARKAVQHSLDWRKRSVPDVEGAAGKAFHHYLLDHCLLDEVSGHHYGYIAFAKKGSCSLWVQSTVWTSFKCVHWAC